MMMPSNDVSVTLAAVSKIAKERRKKRERESERVRKRGRERMIPCPNNCPERKWTTAWPKNANLY